MDPVRADLENIPLKIWLSVLRRGLFGKETALSLHILLSYPPAKTATELSGQSMGVIFIWCVGWIQSFNSAVAHLMYVLVGGLVTASSFLFKHRTQQDSSQLPWVHGASSILSQLMWQCPSSYPAPSQTGPRHQHLFLTATGMGQQLLHGSLIPFSPFGGASPESNIYLLSLSTTSPVVAKSSWWIL